MKAKLALLLSILFIADNAYSKSIICDIQHKPAAGITETLTIALDIDQSLGRVSPSSLNPNKGIAVIFSENDELFSEYYIELSYRVKKNGCIINKPHVNNCWFPENVNERSEKYYTVVYGDNYEFISAKESRRNPNANAANANLKLISCKVEKGNLYNVGSPGELQTGIVLQSKIK